MAMEKLFLAAICRRRQMAMTNTVSSGYFVAGDKWQ